MSAAIGAELDRDVAAAAGNAPPIVDIHVDRKGDDTFEAMVMVSIPFERGTRQVGSWKKPNVPLADMRAIVAWSAGKRGNVRASFSQWRGWTGSHEKNAREVLRVFDGVPVRVVVSRGMPMTERGEPPMGQPSFALALDAHGVPIEVPLYWTITDESDHPRVLADATKAAEALATALAVPCDVI